MHKKSYFHHADPIKGFAHRGCSEDQENTLAAFQRSVAMGYRYLETDVWLTKDGKVVCFHDGTLDRVTNASGRISDYRWDELQEVQVDGEPLLLFEDLLKELPEARVNVDLKDKNSAAPVGQILEKTGAEERVLISAFEDSHRMGFFKHHPRYCGVVASSAGRPTLAALFAASRIGAYEFGKRLRKRMNSDAAQIPQYRNKLRIADQKFVDYCQAIGMEVHVWTINDEPTMKSLVDLGVDGIMTDDGPTLASVLDRHGHWPQI